MYKSIAIQVVTKKICPVTKSWVVESLPKLQIKKKIAHFSFCFLNKAFYSVGHSLTIYVVSVTVASDCRLVVSMTIHHHPWWYTEGIKWQFLPHLVW